MYKNLGVLLGIVLGMFVMMSCSDDPLQESDGFIGEYPNPNPDKLPDNEYWDWVETYPGLVSNSIQRLQGVEVKIKGDYIVNELKLASNPGYLQSTGLYIPPMDTITVVLPAGVGQMYYQIGIASLDLPETDHLKRYHDVCVDGELEVGENKIVSNFGGPLYIYIKGDPQASEIILTVSGAVKSSDFVLGETNEVEWRALVADTINPMIWGELIGKRVILTLPLSTLKSITFPENLLKFYDKMIEDMDFFGGLSSGDLAMPWRIYSDLQLRKDVEGKDSKVYPYYPMGFLSSSADSLSKELVRLPELNGKTILPEGFAALYAMPSWSVNNDIGKELCKLPVFRMFQQNGKWHTIMPSEMWKRPLEPKDRLEVDDDVQLSMLIQLVQEYGWGLLNYISSECRKDIGVDDVVPEMFKNDLLAIYTSEYAGVNLTQFFSEWGFSISGVSLKYMAQYGSVPTDKFWSITSNVAPDPSSEKNPKGMIYPKTIPTLDTLYDRADWIATESSKEGSQVAASMIDGNLNTNWHTKWSTDGGSDYPHWAEFKFKDEEVIEFNYFYHVQINHANPPPRTFILQYWQEGNWQEYVNKSGEKILYLYKDATLRRQVFHLDESIKTSKIRLQYISALPGSRNATCAEFGIGLLK